MGTELTQFRGGEGRAVVVAAVAVAAAFALVAVPDAAGVDAFDAPAVVLGLGLFLAGLAVWVVAFVVAVTRTARGDDVRLGRLFLVEGPVPGAVRWPLAGAFTVTLVTAAATANSNPFGLLVPMLPLGLAGLWGARHGRYPPRAAAGPSPRERGGRR